LVNCMCTSHYIRGTASALGYTCNEFKIKWIAFFCRVPLRHLCVLCVSALSLPWQRLHPAAGFGYARRSNANRSKR